MTERRYSDVETTAIFRIAAQGPDLPAPRASEGDGLTLSDLQAIGKEVGITPEDVARAARAIEIRGGAVTRKLLGLPVGVERRVVLGRKMSGEEWEQLVVQLREVFHARGQTKSDGSLRQWTNGNLYVLLEPTATGHRIRLGSLNGGALASIRLGIFGLGMTGVLGVLSTFFGIEMGSAIPVLLVWSGVALASGALRVPKWARLRAKQMEDLAAQLALTEAQQG